MDRHFFGIEVEKHDSRERARIVPLAIFVARRHEGELSLEVSTSGSGEAFDHGLAAVARALERAGYHITTAETGEASLRLVRTERPALVLLDVVLPDINGIEVCRRIKADATLANVYVVLLSSSRTASLTGASRLAAKVDTSLLQDGYDIYHHAMFVAESGDWAVIQQGLNAGNKRARRYHWSSQCLSDFVQEPHSGIVCDATHDGVMDMTSRDSGSCRRRSLQIARGGSSRFEEDASKVRWGPQRSLLEWENVALPRVEALPPRINWKAMDAIYDFKPRNYEDLVLVRGVGASTVRALALVSDLVYGEPPSWRDPVKYSYCLGGKDGVPYPVDRESYDESIEILNNCIGDAKLGSDEKIRALRRLRRWIPGELRHRAPYWSTGGQSGRPVLMRPIRASPPRG